MYLSANLLWGVGLLVLLFPLVIIDIKSWILPNKLNIVLALFGLLHSFLMEDPHLLESLLGGLLGASVMFIVAKSYEKVRKMEGLGLGDVKLAAAGGLWVGWSMVGMMILIAALSAGVFSCLRAFSMKKFDRLEKIPFGPFLSLGIFGAWMMRHIP
ncbi:MAG: prepilin peptidase [Hyphomicrobium sp.]